MRSFKPDRKNIDEILKRHLQVPKYQRPYTWSAEQIDQLWEDLNTESEDTLFLGIIVLHNRFAEENGDSSELSAAMRLEVIDGQQRLITMTLFIALIRNLFMQQGLTVEANGLHTLIESPSSRGPAEAKIVVSNKLNHLFNTYIQKFDNSEETHNSLMAIELSKYTNEEQNVIRNYRNFYRSVTEDKRWIKNSKTFLLELRERILNTEIIEVVVNSEDDAYDLFETLNSRLVRLSEVDMIKNRIFMKLASELSQEDLEARWDALVRNVAGEKLTPSDVQKFITYYWWSRKQKVPQKQIFRNLRLKDQQETLETLAELESDSQLYKDIVSTDSTNLLQPLGINLNDLKMLSQILNLKQINIPLLALYRKIKLPTYKNDFHNKTVNILINDLERFVIAYRFSPRSPSAIEKVYAENAKNIFKAKNRTSFNQVLLNFQNDLISNAPTRDEYNQKITELIYLPNNSKNNRLVSYLLEKIYFGDTNEIRFNDTNLDHIFPQNPPHKLEPYEIEMLDSVHEIGNLTVLSSALNKKCGNKLPPEKIEIYKESQIKNNLELAHSIDSKHWDATSISMRTEDLRNKIWDYLSSAVA